MSKPGFRLRAVDESFDQLRERVEEHDRLPPGGGGGSSGDMEPRIARLEAHMEHVRAELAKLGSMPVQLAELKVRVDHLPTKGFIVTATITTITLITAAIAFGDKLQALVGG